MNAGCHAFCGFATRPLTSARIATGSTQKRPHVTEIPIGKQGIGFDRFEFDAWVDEYVSRNGRPARAKGVTSWDANEYPASSCGPGLGISTSAFSGGEFAKALAQIRSRTPLEREVHHVTT
jgi:hypothetical protein